MKLFGGYPDNESFLINMKYYLNLLKKNRNYVSINKTKLSIVKFFTRATKYAHSAPYDMCYGLGQLVNNRLIGKIID